MDKTPERKNAYKIKFLNLFKQEFAHKFYPPLKRLKSKELGAQLF